MCISGDTVFSRVAEDVANLRLPSPTAVHYSMAGRRTCYHGHRSSSTSPAHWAYLRDLSPSKPFGESTMMTSESQSAGLEILFGLQANKYRRRGMVSSQPVK